MFKKIALALSAAAMVAVPAAAERARLLRWLRLLSYGYAYPSYGYSYPSYGYSYPSYGYSYPSLRLQLSELRVPQRLQRLWLQQLWRQQRWRRAGWRRDRAGDR